MLLVSNVSSEATLWRSVGACPVYCSRPTLSIMVRLRREEKSTSSIEVVAANHQLFCKWKWKQKCESEFWVVICVVATLFLRNTHREMHISIIVLSS